MQGVLSERSSAAALLWHLLFKDFGVSRLSFADHYYFVEKFPNMTGCLVQACVPEHGYPAPYKIINTHLADGIKLN